MGSVTVRYFAGAKAAAGRETEVVSLPDGATLADLKALLASREGFGAVCLASSFLVDGSQADAETELPGAAVVDVLPPFAGG
ncbi:MoaD/ThiS family protein [Nocardioides sp.]|uniref:MoaD/ThiS family protein n=1 Tax=Nocardioides sp. TaxID=35761 RepID=UPI002634C3D9|nr:MoaD/ThiS family protein [Nocardioides sp.]